MADPFSTDQEPDPPIVNVDLFKLIRAYLLLTMVNISAIENSLLDVYASLRALNLSEAAQVRSPELAQSYAHVGYGMSILSHRLARGYIRRADASLVGLENLSTAGSVLLVSSIYALCIGDWPAGERSCARALEISDRLGDRANWAHTLSVLGYITFFQGKFERSLQLFIDHYQEGLAQNHVQFQAMALASQVWVSFMRGQTTQALAIAEGVLPLFALGSGTAIPESVTHGILASAHVREGQFNQARQAATTASALLARAPIGFYPDIFTYGYIAEVYLALWDREKHQKTNAAAEFRRLARQTCRSMRRLARWFPVGRSRAWLLQGVFDWVDGRPGRANRAWQKSLVAAQKLGMPYDEALAYHAMGQYAAGSEQAANLARAGEIFDRLGVVRGGGWRFGEWSWRG